MYFADSEPTTSISRHKLVKLNLRTGIVGLGRLSPIEYFRSPQFPCGPWNGRIAGPDPQEAAILQINFISPHMYSPSYDAWLKVSSMNLG
jgi:hypothetical protein